LALFPVSLRPGKATIENTNAVIIAQSVEQAIREGLAHRKGQSDDGRWTFFVFSHPGVKDALPVTVDQARPSADYYILLPEDDSDERRKRLENRESAYNRGKVFVYPESDGLSWTESAAGTDRTVEDMDSGATPNGGGDPTRADDDADDLTRVMELPDGEREVTSYEVFRTYSLDEEFIDHVGEDVDSELSLGFDERDPIRDYSFAFTIRRALNDGSLGRQAPSDREFVPANELFEVEVLVYRSFVSRTAGADNPILRARFLVHK
ncbi:MAG: hypothetical protein KDC38_17180, partial [Planctomycetes bacterium]|nr:hypothetical protein [Planctomycetota bacterium]